MYSVYIIIYIYVYIPLYIYRVIATALIRLVPVLEAILLFLFPAIP